MLLPEVWIWVSPKDPYCILPPAATACLQLPLPSKSPWGLQVSGALKWRWKASAVLLKLFDKISGHTSLEYVSFPVALLKLYFKINP